MAEHGSPIIAILDGRATASQTRLYYAHSVIGHLKKNKIQLPQRYWGRFEFWAWQFADRIIGQASLKDFEAWIESDKCIGSLL